MIKIGNEFNQEEIEILLNEFIVMSGKITKENLHIEILKYLRQKHIKISSLKLFNEFYELVEKKYL